MEKKPKKANHSTQQTSQQEIMSFLACITNYIENEQLIPKNATIVLGLSGGPDSVFLLSVLLELKKEGRIKELIVAHLDHEWRSNSANDVAFCKAIAQSHSLPFETAKMSDLKINLKWDGSKEQIARTARRFFLESIAKKYSADAIALGQHAQDQQETFFIRLLRGTSLSGLCGIWPKRGIYIRPLLHTYKSEIHAYLERNGIAYLEDPSNREQSFLRNRIRAHVIPALKQADDRFDRSFEQTIARLQQTEQYLDQHAKTLLNEMSETLDGIHSINVKKLLAHPPIMQSRLIILWLTQENVQFPVTQTFIDELLRFIASPRGGTHALHENWKIVQKQGQIRIEKT